MNKELMEEIKELIDEKSLQEKGLINGFFDLLFWKNYGEGYVNVDDKLNILEEIKNVGDTKKILPFVNKIRKQIGLKELTLELNNCLMEITPRIKKELILKRLE